MVVVRDTKDRAGAVLTFGAGCLGAVRGHGQERGQGVRPRRHLPQGTDRQASTPSGVAFCLPLLTLRMGALTGGTAQRVARVLPGRCHRELMSLSNAKVRSTRNFAQCEAAPIRHSANLASTASSTAG